VPYEHPAITKDTAMPILRNGLQLLAGQLSFPASTTSAGKRTRLHFHNLALAQAQHALAASGKSMVMGDN
jgi:hypothetical protein